MEQYIYKVVIIALVSAFILMLARKWGIIEYMQVHGNDIIHRMSSCNFCLSWWTCNIVSILFAIITKDWTYMLVPMCSTSITSRLL